MKKRYFLTPDHDIDYRLVENWLMEKAKEGYELKKFGKRVINANLKMYKNAHLNMYNFDPFPSYFTWGDKDVLSIKFNY